MKNNTIKAKTKEELIQRWGKWCDCFYDSDRNTINSQLSDMLWDFGIWNLWYKSRAHIQKDENDHPKANGHFHTLVDRNFYEAQMFAIRRLTDTYGIDGKRGVYSLTSLLEEMKDNADWLTRENIFEMRKLPYDYSEMKAKQKAYIDSLPRGGSFTIPKELDYSDSEDLHHLIDIISNMPDKSRRPEDQILPCFFDNMNNSLAEHCNQFRDVVDKYFAHAATKESRKELDEQERHIMLKEYKIAHSYLCRYADAIQVLLLGKSNHQLPIPPPDLFQYWDIPIFQGTDAAVLHQYWNEYNEEVMKWCSISYEEIGELKKGRI